MALINPHYSGDRNFRTYDEATPSNQLQFKANVAIAYATGTNLLTVTPTGLVANSASYYVVNVSQGELYHVVNINTAVPAAASINLSTLGYAAGEPVQILFEARGAAGSGQAERLVGSAVFEDITANRSVTFNNL